MKILWVTNIPFGPINDFLETKPAASGSWLDATYNMVKNKDNLELVLVTVWETNKILHYKSENVAIYVIPKGKEKNYNVNSRENIYFWQQIYDAEKPDLLQIWGTEFSHGLLAQKVMAHIPSVIYMQGLMSQIAKHYLSDISFSEIIKNITFRDLVSFDNIYQQKNKFLKRASVEAEMLKMAKYVIVENDWCATHCQIINPNIKVLYSKLPIKQEFFNYNWDDTYVPNTIMSIAGGYPIKGLHILLKAISIVKKQKKDIKLLIPGDNNVKVNSLKEKIKITSYSKYLNTLIEKYDLIDNVKFLGRLNSDEMASAMEKSNIFVMPSSIENHSSSLIEAMIVGMPTIATYVGGVPEYITNGENGFIYRYNEYEILAHHILSLLDNPNLAKKIGVNARDSMREKRKISLIKEEVFQIYKTISQDYNINF